MENVTPQQVAQTTLKRKWSFKFKMHLILLIILIGFGVYGYYWFRTTQQLRFEAQNVVEGAEKYNELQAFIQEERNRCEKFISQEEGDFGSFEYCKKFIQWENNKENFI